VTPARRQLLLVVFATALVLRVASNEMLVADPLYYRPLGGNVPLLVTGQEIAQGDLFPIKGPFTENSPLYPYLLAGIYSITSVNDFHAVRVAGSIADALTCTLVAWLALGFLGPVGGLAAGLALAFYGPLIFFATELVPVPFMLLLVTVALVLLELARRKTADPDRPDGGAQPPWALWGGAGLALGLAAGLHPDVLVCGVLALALPLLWRVPRRLAATATLAAGLALGVAPVTAMNVRASGRFVLLTTAGGHNFYIGHNPEAQPQFVVPLALNQGDTFTTMQRLAEQAEGHPLRADEVSGYYLRKGLAWAVGHPGREAQLFFGRVLALVNKFEVTTYADYYYEQDISPVLRWTLTLGWLFPLALLGMVVSWSRARAHLWIPVLNAAAICLIFFEIARLRAVMLPSLGFFAGAGVVAVVEAVRAHRTRRLALAAVVVLCGALAANWPFLRVDTSNEWNKAGGVLRLQHRLPEAELAFQRALEANPQNTDGFKNLAVLYRETGRAREAARFDSLAAVSAARDQRALDEYRKSLGEVGR
jgi:hypothetical protein